MDYQEPDDPLRTIMTIIVVAAIISLMISLFGCSSVKHCPECIPEVHTVEVKVPVYSCPPTEELPPLVLPEWPVLPEGATDQELKEFYSACVATLHAREKTLEDYIEMLKAHLP
jgi:hypothetical protein